MSSFRYHVVHDPDDLGWVVCAEGYVAHSLPYDTREDAIEHALQRIHDHPGSELVVDDLAHPLPRLVAPAEEHW